MTYRGERIDPDKYAKDATYRDQISLFSGLACDPATDVAKQEDKVPSSTDFLLQKFLSNPLQMREGVSGEENRTTDLQESITPSQDAIAAFSALPDELQLKYGTASRFVGAMLRREYVPPVKEEKKEEPPKVEEPVKP